VDQRIVAGLGNIYVCEALHRAHIRPEKEAGRVLLPALKGLVPAIRSVLEESIAAGGSTIRDYAQPSGELGYFAASWRVYGREGEACPCGGTVERLAQGGRSTFWCYRQSHCGRNAARQRTDMANTPQSKKRIRRNGRRTAVNTNRMSRIRTFIKKVESAIEGGDKTAAAEALKAAQPELARGVARGVLHKNTASRKFSRLTKRVAAL
jgi:ribosomal protein S20